MYNPKIEETYKKWWEGKYCKFPGQDGDFKLVTEVTFLGPPSGVYGIVEFWYEDGSSTFVPFPDNVFKPRKTDVIVRGEIK